jgi:hypothetical protein
MHWLEKKAQGRALGLPLRGSPIFVARISSPRKMIKHGRKMASKAKRGRCCSDDTSGVERWLLMGFPSPS